MLSCQISLRLNRFYNIFQSTMALEGKKLTCIQKSEPASTITREWDGDTMTMVSCMGES